jgi:Cytochrome c3
LRKYITIYLTGLFLLFFLSCGVKELDKTASIKTPASPGPGECNTCHKDKEVLPQGHVDTAEMKGSNCDSCHSEGETSLRTKMPLSHKHKMEGMSCNDCHKEPAPYTAVSSNVCQGCHNDTKALFEAAKEVAVNPHFSPHDGKIPDCNKCHHQHKKSENYCSGCHGVESKVP